MIQMDDVRKGDTFLFNDSEFAFKLIPIIFQKSFLIPINYHQLLFTLILRKVQEVNI